MLKVRLEITDSDNRVTAVEDSLYDEDGKMTDAIYIHDAAEQLKSLSLALLHAHYGYALRGEEE